MNYCMFINITQRLLHAVRNILLIVIGDSKLTVHKCDLIKYYRRFYIQYHLQ